VLERGYAGSRIWTTSQPKFEEHGVDYRPYETYQLYGSPPLLSPTQKVCKFGREICEWETAPPPAWPLVTKTKGSLRTCSMFPGGGISRCRELDTRPGRSQSIW
jgi:hypothetical protein